MFSPEKYVCWQALQQGITLMPLENVQGGDMPGDTVHISAPVCRRVEKLLPHLVTKLEEKYGTDIPAKLVIAVSGGSGSGKTSGAAALREALAMVGLKGYVLSGDNYPRRIPQHNDEERLTGNTLRNASPTCSHCRKPETTVIRANVWHTHGCKSTNREGGPRWRDIWAGLPSRTTTH